MGFYEVYMKYGRYADGIGSAWSRHGINVRSENQHQFLKVLEFLMR